MRAARTFGELLQRAKRGETDNLKIRQEDDTIFRMLECLILDFRAGRQWDQDDCEFLTLVILGLVVLPMRRGRGAKDSQMKKDFVTAVGYGRHYRRRLRKIGHPVLFANEHTAHELRRRFPSVFANKKTKTIMGYLEHPKRVNSIP